MTEPTAPTATTGPTGPDDAPDVVPDVVPDGAPDGAPDVVVLDGPLIVGSGLAGLTLALALAPTPCTVATDGDLGDDTSTALAQGGIAAAVGPDDSPARHATDTHAAGAGLCRADAVDAVTGAGPDVVDRLLSLGTRFDTAPDGSPALGLEGAHSQRRILHADGDSSGAELLRVTRDAVRAAPSVRVLTGTRVVRVLTAERTGHVVGALAHRHGRPVVLATDRVVLATGGIGGLYAHTTNPLTSRGQGLALAARAGATLRDVEMVQLHPTALDVGLDPMPLVSEAVRGEGATLVDDTGHLVADPLAARDVVARAVWAVITAGGHVHLDARVVPGFADRFPRITAACRAAGLDPARDPLPVRPAAHYHMGGIRTDLAGRTDVPGLYATGECASTGLHGANRLASNSLLEAAALAPAIAHALRTDTPVGGDATGATGAADATDSAGAAAAHRAAARAAVLAARRERPAAGPAPVDVRGLVDRHAGVVRDATGLRALAAELAPHAAHDDALVGLLLADAALARAESRGGHHRSDHPGTAATARHTLTRLTRAGCTTTLTPAAPAAPIDPAAPVAPPVAAAPAVSGRPDRAIRRAVPDHPSTPAPDRTLTPHHALEAAS